MSMQPDLLIHDGEATSQTMLQARTASFVNICACSRYNKFIQSKIYSISLYERHLLKVASVCTSHSTL
jgi:hypothetical protein